MNKIIIATLLTAVAFNANAQTALGGNNSVPYKYAKECMNERWNTVKCSTGNKTVRDRELKKSVAVTPTGARTSRLTMNFMTVQNSKGANKRIIYALNGTTNANKAQADMAACKYSYDDIALVFKHGDASPDRDATAFGLMRVQQAPRQRDERVFATDAYGNIMGINEMAEFDVSSFLDLNLQEHCPWNR